MVDQADLATIGMLNGELQQIRSARQMLDAPGRIASFLWESDAADPPARQSMTVQTATMAFPPQMLEAIKGYLASREQEIADQMSGLGVTGVDAEGRGAPSPTAAPAKRGARK